MGIFTEKCIASISKGVASIIFENLMYNVKKLIHYNII